MNKRGAICCLWLGLCGPSLFGQQVLLSYVSSPPETATALSAPHIALPPAGPVSPEIKVASGDFAVGQLIMPGVASNLSFGEAMAPQPQNAVCTQALPSREWNRPSDYAF